MKTLLEVRRKRQELLVAQAENRREFEEWDNIENFNAIPIFEAQIELIDWVLS